MVIFNKLVCSALLVLAAFTTLTTCEEATSSKPRSKSVRGGLARKTSRILTPKTGGITPSSGKGSGKGGSKGGSKKCKGDDDLFTNPEGSDVCLVPAVSYEIEGPTTPIPTGAAAAAGTPAGDSFQECNKLLLNTPPDFIGKFECLACNDVIIGPWFFHRDTPGSQFVFTDEYGGTNDSDGSVCSEITKNRATPITSTSQKPKADIELWNEDFHGTKLADLTSFSVDYNVVSQRDTGGNTNQYFVNIYTRVTAGRTNFYDCRFDYVPDTVAPAAPSGWKSLTIDLDTVASDVVQSSTAPVLAPPLNCDAFTSLQDMVAAYPNAVIGIGLPGAFETIDLVTGETGSDYKGLQLCWDNVQIAVKDEETIVYDFEPN